MADREMSFLEHLEDLRSSSAQFCHSIAAVAAGKRLSCVAQAEKTTNLSATVSCIQYIGF